MKTLTFTFLTTLAILISMMIGVSSASAQSDVFTLYQEENTEVKLLVGQEDPFLQTCILEFTGTDNDTFSISTAYNEDGETLDFMLFMKIHLMAEPVANGQVSKFIGFLNENNEPVHGDEWRINFTQKSIAPGTAIAYFPPIVADALKLLRQMRRNHVLVWASRGRVISSWDLTYIENGIQNLTECSASMAKPEIQGDL